MNKPVYVGMSVLDISKTLMYKFWCDFIKPKYLDRTKLCYTDTDIFITHIITEDFFEDICSPTHTNCNNTCCMYELNMFQGPDNIRSKIA